MRSSERPVLETGSTDRPDLARERRLRRDDAQRDGLWDVSGLCGATPDLQAPAPGGPKGIARTPMGGPQQGSESDSQPKEATYGIPRAHRVDGSPDAPCGL